MDTPDMTDEEMYIFLRQQVERLHEVFPHVQVLASWECRKWGTRFLPMGRGNSFARKSMCMEWVDCDGIQMEADDEEEYHAAMHDPEEDDDRGEDISGVD